MKLIYKTSNLSRAEEIKNVLLDQNIEASIQGKHSHGINKYIPGGNLSVWIHDNAKTEKAERILSDLYKSEGPPDMGVKRFNPFSVSSIGLFVIGWIVLTIIVVLGLS